MNDSQETRTDASAFAGENDIIMKIAVVGTRGFPGVQGGIENHCENLYSYLASTECDITVFVRKPYMVANVNEFKGIKLISINCPQSKLLETLVHTFSSILAARKLRPDILHIHAIGPSLFAPLGRLLGMKVVVTTHGPDYMREKWPLPAKYFLKWCEWMGMSFANSVIAISGNIAHDIESKYGRASTIIPNGVAIPQIVGTDDILKKYGLHRKEYLLAVGRFVPEKGFNELIDAFIMGKFDQCKLVIVGDADHETEFSRNLKGRAARHPNIIMTGFLTGRFLHEIYSHAGLFVLASYYEGLPIVLLEAMSYGLSCIASDIPANRNVALPEDRFFRVGDVEALSRKIRKYIHRKQEASEINKQIDMISATYDWAAIAKKTFNVYRDTIR